MEKLVYKTDKDKGNQRVRIIKGPETQKEIWARCVREGKLLVMNRDKTRIKICELAGEACEIKWGGGAHWSGFKNQKTVTAFAEEIGIKPRTLLEWLAVKKYVYDNLNKKYKEDIDWSSMARTRREMQPKRANPPSKTKVTEVYESHLDSKNEKVTLLTSKDTWGILSIIWKMSIRYVRKRLCKRCKFC